MKKTVDNSSNILDDKNVEVPKLKERHIVSWTQEEDDILRDLIRLHAAENWAIIASKFKDKTTRQCRRRWFTYLNSDFKNGGWSPEEDILLCEAQKIYGNRWTEIAKVVSGRTDNAVKNRFTTLCKKKAKHESLAKENSTTSYINLNNKRVIFRNGLNANGGSESSASLKRIRHPFAVISQSVQSCEVNFPTRVDVNEASTDRSIDNSIRRTYIKKDDPKVLALMQQAELLSSLAIKVNTENTDQSLENAWTVLQDFLEQNKESQLLMIGDSDTDFQVEKFKELLEDLRSCSEGSRSSWREADVYESSPGSSEYSTGSTLLSSVPHDKHEESEAQICVLQPQQPENPLCLAEKNSICHTSSTNQVKITEFSSPIHVTPLFRSLAAAIPNPKFSESQEKHFLMKTLGMESASPSRLANSSQPPPCKRSLLQCL